jgi:hypothetical protein
LNPFRALSTAALLSYDAKYKLPQLDLLIDACDDYARMLWLPDDHQNSMVCV